MVSGSLPYYAHMDFISRAAWGARAPKGSYSRWRNGRPEGIAVHWVGGGAMRLDPAGRADASVRSIQSYEMGREYIDIAYNTLVDPAGHVYEGRGFGYASAANGPAANGTLHAVCYLAGVGDPFITPRAQGAIVEIASLVGGVRRAHRDVNQTFCPGNDIANWVHGPLQGVIVSTGSHRSPPSPPPPTAAGLVGVYQALHRLASTIRTGPVLRQGSRGAAVSDVQFAAVGGFGQGLVIDGVFGEQTEMAVENVQAFGRISRDGIVGPQTRAVLAGVLAKRYP